MISGVTVANLLQWSLQIGGIAAAASLLPSLFRLDAAGVRYAYWRGVAVLCLALPWIQPYRITHSVAATVATGVTTSAGPSVGAAVKSVPSIEWESVLLFVLILGIIVRLAWLAVGVIRLRKLRARGSDVALATDQKELIATLGTDAEIRSMPSLDQPITFGLFRPMVMLPSALDQQPPDIQRAVLGHELLHVKRRDWAWLIIEEIAVCLFWFHPASWWLASQIQHAREELVDELAIQLTGRRKAYVEALLAFSDATTVVPTAAFARRRHLFRRIALVSKENVMSSRRIVVTCAAMALLVGASGWYVVSALPLEIRGQSDRVTSSEPGPLELKAHNVTPENPIPRRVHYEEPALPETEAHGNIQIKVTLDEVGRVAEARMVAINLHGPKFSFAISADASGRFSGNARAIAHPDSEEAINAVTSVLDASLSAVRQWRYDPPFEAPLAFTVDVNIGTPVMEFKPAREGDALHVGGNVQAPRKIKDVRPEYPPIARAAGVAGVVILEVRIGTDGLVEEARVLRSIPLLDQAALDAVKQWQFVPTLMNGVPTPVMMTVTMNFAQPQ